ncbi:MAG: hypothetical protein ACK52K_01095 [Alphaproteobacteria bacterium]
MGSSRIRHFLLMLPFFLVGIAVPTFLFGFFGDGPPKMAEQRYSPVEAQPVPASPQDGAGAGAGAGSGAGPGGAAPQGPADATRPWDYDFGPQRQPPAAVGFMRSLYEGFVERFVSQSLSPATIKLGAFLLIFGVSFLCIRLFFALITGSVGSIMAFLVQKAAAPMFMGFLAVGSTWGIHQTVAQEFGMPWAATTVTLTAAIASLFALAGVKIR